MMRCVKPFQARYGGEIVTIDTDTRVAAEHDLAHRYPDAFVADDDPFVGARSRSAETTTTRPRKPAAVRAKPRARIKPPEQSGVTLRTTPSQVTVAIPDTALRLIGDECARREYDCVETGGLLAGPVAWSWMLALNVGFARGPGPAAQHNRDGLRMDVNSYAALDRELAMHESAYRLCGDWHSHPGSGQPLPSEADLAAWRAGLDHIHEAHGSSRYIGVIATPSAQGYWYQPTLHIYLVSRDQWGQATCEPAGGER
jgi:proteasome lid subunit RPN8/RPN11